MHRLLLAVLLVVPPLAHATPLSPDAACRAQKVKATASAIVKLTSCANDPACQIKADTSLAAKITKVEAKGGCPATGEAATYTSTVHGFLTTLQPPLSVGSICSPTSTTAGVSCTSDGQCPHGSCIPNYCLWAVKAAGKNGASTLTALAMAYKNPDQALLDAAVAKADTKLQATFAKPPRGGCVAPEGLDVIAAVRDGLGPVCQLAACPLPIPPPPGTTTTVTMTVPTSSSTNSTTTTTDTSSTTTSSTTTTTTVTTTTTTTIPCSNSGDCQDGDPCTFNFCAGCSEPECRAGSIPSCVPEDTYGCCLFLGRNACLYVLITFTAPAGYCAYVGSDQASCPAGTQGSETLFLPPGATFDDSCLTGLSRCAMPDGQCGIVIGGICQ